MLSVELSCPCCQWRTISGEADALRRLRSLGLFRRAKEPPEDLVREMIRTQGHRLTCDRCRMSGLTLVVDAADDSSGEWEQVTVCEVCRQPVPAERIAAMPDTKRCVHCQSAVDGGATFVEPDYCPRCGAVLELRLSRAGGIAQYKQFCTGDPPCRL